MAANPLNAFLQGFAAVDQLETNRLNRQLIADQQSFAREEQSQLRKQWDRQDTEYDRQIMERRQADNLVHFDATVAEIMSDKNTSTELLADENGVYNEAIKRMIAQYPEFGEHMALALGLDPSAGPLIKDKQRPVLSAFAASADKDPAGVGGIAFEVNSINGPQPYTDNRSANPNDPVTLKQFGMSELVKLFGAGVMKNDVAIAAQIRRAAGIVPTGNPTERQDQAAKQSTAEQPTTQQPTAKQPTAEQPAAAASGVTEDTPRTGMFREPGADGHSVVAPENKGSINPFHTGRPATLPRSEFTSRELREAELRDTFTNSNAPASSRLAAGLNLMGSNLAYLVGLRGADEGDTAVDDVARTVSAGIDAGLGAGGGIQEAVDQGAGFIADTVYEMATGKPPATQGQGIDAKGTIAFLDKLTGGKAETLAAGTKTVDTPVNTVKDISTATGSSAADYNRSNFTTPNEPAARTVLSTPIPGNQEVVKSAATRVLNTTELPNLVDMYNAVGLLKLGIIDTEQIMRYAETNQFSEAAKRELQIVQSEGYARVFDKNTGGLSPAVQIAPGGGGATTKQTIADRNAIRKLTVDTVEGNFVDDEGNVNKRHLQQFMDVQDGVFNIAGISSTDERRTEPSHLRSIAAGSKFVSMFNEDDIQLFDFSYGDVEIPHTAGNVAIGQVADEVGITSQKEATYFLRDYAHTLRNGLDARNDAWLVNVVREAEAFVEDARTNKDNPQHDIYKGLSQREARTLYVKRTVAKE